MRWAGRHVRASVYFVVPADMISRGVRLFSGYGGMNKGCSHDEHIPYNGNHDSVLSDPAGLAALDRRRILPGPTRDVGRQVGFQFCRLCAMCNPTARVRQLGLEHSNRAAGEAHPPFP